MLLVEDARHELWLSKEPLERPLEQLDLQGTN
jgi:hypothetical protein